MIITTKCQYCGAAFQFEVKDEDYQKWENGMPIRRAMPYITFNQLALLDVEICGNCVGLDDRI